MTAASFERPEWLSKVTNAQLLDIERGEFREVTQGQLRALALELRLRREAEGWCDSCSSGPCHCERKP